jgi:phospholipase/lecithinase/hemolysin
MLHTLARWTLLTFAFVFVSLAHAQGCQNRLVVFGDSLTDPGNLYVAFGVTAKAPFALIPDAPYSIGGHHFSNGRTWAEQSADALGSPASGAPALLGPGVFTNYAVGGARARPGASPTPYDLTTEVTLFLSNFSGRACPDATYVLWIGGDDLQDALDALSSSGLSGANTIITAAVTSIADNVGALWSAGARKFLILDAPDISHAPAVRLLGPAAINSGHVLSASFNSGLGSAIVELQAALPQIHITRFDDNALVNAIVASPAAFGLSDALDPCLKFGVIADPLCRVPPRFFFWDGIHPTTVGHGILASALLTNAFQ